ncbi:MAG: GNAT family N-acetyltransferase [Ferrimicrobium sp.]
MDDATIEKISISILTETDWQLWRSLRLQALADAPYAFGSTLEQWSGKSDQESRWRDRLRNSALALVCLFDHQPAGMVATTTPTAGETELVSLWVSPEFRGRGVGDRLIGEVLRWASERDLAQVRLYVREMNRAAIALYERHGFVDTGERCDEMDGMCEVSMLRALRQP